MQLFVSEQIYTCIIIYCRTFKIFKAASFFMQNSVTQACYGHILHSFYKVCTLKPLNKPRNILNTLKYFLPSEERNYALILQ